MKKKIPAFETDQEAERFIDTADLSDYDLSGVEPVRFEFEKKNARVNMRLPQPLLDTLKEHAKRRGIPYQRFIREALEQAVIGAVGGVANGGMPEVRSGLPGGSARTSDRTSGRGEGDPFEAGKQASIAKKAVDKRTYKSTYYLNEHICFRF